MKNWQREIVSGTSALYECFLVGTSGTDFVLWIEFNIFLNESESNMKSQTIKCTGKKEGLRDKWEWKNCMI